MALLLVRLLHLAAFSHQSLRMPVPFFCRPRQLRQCDAPTFQGQAGPLGRPFLLPLSLVFCSKLKQIAEPRRDNCPPSHRWLGESVFDAPFRLERFQDRNELEARPPRSADKIVDGVACCPRLLRMENPNCRDPFRKGSSDSRGVCG